MISTGFQIFTSTQPVLCFCVFAGKNAVYLANQSCKDGKSKALCHNQKQTIQEFGTAEFLSFGTRQLHKLRVFRCQNEALCHKARHRGSRGALAHKNSLLTKRREPKPTNSACAEFANQNANAVSQSLRIQLALNSLIRTPVSLAEKHSKAKTGKLSPEFGFAEFLSFVPLQRKTQFL